MKGYWQAVETSKCSILVTSCDKYEDAWKPFFELFHIMWPDCPYPMYLNTETKEYRGGSIPVTALHPSSLTDKKGKEISWSKRLKNAVENIDSDYILFFLEDFFLMSPVRDDIVAESIEWMEQDDSIAIIDFYPEYHKDEIVHEEFSEINPKYDFCVNTMSALWRKDFLIRILRDENPWDFEFFATGRWRRSKTHIYTHRAEFPAVFDYQIIPKYGYGIYQGKWLKNNVELFSKFGIDVDFEKRGFTDPPKQSHRVKRTKKEIASDLIHFRNYPHYFDCLTKRLKYRFKMFRVKWLNF